MTWKHNTISQSFFARHPERVARDLLGCFLIREIQGKVMVGKIVETEAYLSTDDDPASHGYTKQSERTHSLYGPAGHAYVTTVHQYHIMNVVTEEVDQPSAVLIRALEPIAGINMMKQYRPSSLLNLTNGPGKLCLALHITKDLDGISVHKEDARISFKHRKEPLQASEIGISPRIGISKAVDLPLRFYIRNNPFVSGSKKYRV